MKNMKKIDSESWYSLTDLAKVNAFPWCNGDIRRVRRMVIADKKNGNHLKAVVSGKGGTTRYQIKGANIIRFVSAFESGKVKL